MNELNDNLKKWLFENLTAATKSKSASAVLRTLSLGYTLLVLFVFDQDFFGWWRIGLPHATDHTLVGLMTAVSALYSAFYVVSICVFRRVQNVLKGRWILSHGAAVRLELLAFYYAFIAIWGCTYLTGCESWFWGYSIVVFVAAGAIDIAIHKVCGGTAELWRESSVTSEALPKAGEPTVSASTNTARSTVRSRNRAKWRRKWWDLTHPAYRRRMRPMDRSLWTAVEQSDVASVAACLSRGGNANLRFRYDNSLLLRALIRGHGEVVRLLLEAGADPDTISPRMGTPLLIYAVMKGDLVSARLLLEHGAVVNAPSRSGTTALGFAGWRENAEMVRLLVAHGADVNARNKGGGTALITAAWFGHTETVRALLEAGTDPTLRDDKGTDALDYAKRKNRTEVVTLLEAVTAGDKPTATI